MHGRMLVVVVCVWWWWGGGGQRQRQRRLKTSIVEHLSGNLVFAHLLSLSSIHSIYYCRGKGNLAGMVKQHTWGLPPKGAIKRIALEQDWQAADGGSSGGADAGSDGGLLPAEEQQQLQRLGGVALEEAELDVLAQSMPPLSTSAAPGADGSSAEEITPAEAADLRQWRPLVGQQQAVSTAALEQAVALLDEADDDSVLLQAVAAPDLGITAVGSDAAAAHAGTGVDEDAVLLAAAAAVEASLPEDSGSSSGGAADFGASSGRGLLRGRGLVWRGQVPARFSSAPTL